MDAFLPYFAGFFDGEGSIGIYPNGSGRGRTLRVQLTQTVTPESTLLLHECRLRWGGCLSLMNRSAKRPAWNWQASASSGAGVLRDVAGHLRLKREEADIALTYWQSRAKLQRSMDGRFVPFTEAELDLGILAEGRLKAAKHTVPFDPAELLIDAVGRLDRERSSLRGTDVMGE